LFVSWVEDRVKQKDSFGKKKREEKKIFKEKKNKPGIGILMWVRRGGEKKRGFRFTQKKVKPTPRKEREEIKEKPKKGVKNVHGAAHQRTKPKMDSARESNREEGVFQ